MAPRKEIYRDDFISVVLEQGGKLVRLVRSAEPFPDIGALQTSYGNVIAAAKPYLTVETCVLNDQRLAPGRNDAAFEEAMGQIRRQLYPLFRKRAVLVQFSVGKLQLQRLQKEDKLERLVSQDEAALLRYLGF
jgi:hypothetical protein